MPESWFTSATPVLNQLGATIGGGRATYQGVDYSQVFENLRAQQQREADRQYELQRRQLEQQYKTARMQARTAQERNEIDKWYNEQQIEIARLRLGEEQRQFNVSTGHNLLKTAAELRGPADWFQASAYQRGVANDPNNAAFLQALQQNAKLPGFGAQQGVPQAETLNTLTAKLGGTFQADTGGSTNASGQSAIAGGGSPMTTATTAGASSTAATGNDARLAQIRGIYGQGAHKLTSGALEQLSPTEMALLQSGIEASGGDYAGFLDQYRKSRVGQGLGMSRAA